MAWNWLGFGLALGAQLAVLPVFAADLDTIRARGHLVVAVRDGWQPLSFRDREGDLLGLEVDLAHGLATAIFADPAAVEFVVVPNGDRIPAVLEDRADVAIAGLTLTSGRQRLVSFSPPYYLDGTAVLVRDPQMQSLSDLQRQRLGVLQGASTVAIVRYLLPLAILTPLSSYQDAFNRLSTGQIDGFAGDVTVLSGWQQAHSGYYLVPSLLSAEPLAIALPKGTQYTELRTLINQTVIDWHQSGWLEERTTFWGLP
ncbi:MULTISPECIES: transporter substrate-binding domain-containing protein [Cyanophyceae]|uniref:transporter substrate-binding domain-containing protein n=1 Tax=unclassified Leptolyngbya TaxID=2650499 RepID=UPI0016839831|nr:transporter substrate-binding domain-containing protein [Leptolyngbya sp. FACHB-60]MBD1915227.1 transporter substrate-binding domain-containing protein [Phormidium sp. FACHB-77]MBD2032496.1 transporter substrate-binding domain-containing protein [Phormidium sp. FACHB-322]MBD2050973.1 transporter substrate-binding domain-containing protein [Leptolyngbya sp. FACHB-60]